MRNIYRTHSARALKPSYLALTMAAAIAVTSAPLHADDDVAEDAQERAAVAASTLTLAQALEAAGKEYPGARIIKAEVDTENGAPSYVVDVEKDGVQRLVFDLKTGQMTKMAAEVDDHQGDDNGSRSDEEDDSD